MTRYRCDSGPNAVNQLSPPLAIQPWSSTTVGAPGGPSTTRANVVPRPGSSTRSPRGNGGVGATSVTAAMRPNLRPTRFRP
jgi:hypothetical protein